MINDDSTNTNNNDDNNNNNDNNDRNNNNETFKKIKVFLQHQNLYTCSRETLPEMGNNSLDTKWFAIPGIFRRTIFQNFNLIELLFSEQV